MTIEQINAVEKAADAWTREAFDYLHGLGPKPGPAPAGIDRPLRLLVEDWANRPGRGTK